MNGCLDHGVLGPVTGPGVQVLALEKFLDIADRDGFQTENIDNYAGVITFGQGDQELGVAVHVDVVPPDEGWSQDES